MIRHLAAIAVFLWAAASWAVPADRGTPEDAIAMVERVAAFYASEGLEATVAAIMDAENGDFHDRDLYAVLLGFEGEILAHGSNPRFVGRDMINLRDQNGVYIAQEMIRTARDSGNGWVNYLFVNPATKKIEPKTSYVLKIDTGLLVAVGVYR